MLTKSILTLSLLIFLNLSRRKKCSGSERQHKLEMLCQFYLPKMAMSCSLTKRLSLCLRDTGLCFPDAVIAALMENIRDKN